jgi:hypothetical protein
MSRAGDALNGSVTIKDGILASSSIVLNLPNLHNLPESDSP